MELTTKEITFDELRDLSNHARSVAAAVKEKAVEHDDEPLHLAARSLQRLCQRLTEHAKDDVPDVEGVPTELIE